MAMVALADPLVNMEEQCTSQAIASSNAGAYGVGVDDLSSEMIAKLLPVMYRSVTKEMCKCMDQNLTYGHYQWGEVANKYRQVCNSALEVATKYKNSTISKDEAIIQTKKIEDDFNKWVLNTDAFLHVAQGIQTQNERYQQYEKQRQLELEAAVWAAFSPEERAAHIQAQAINRQTNAIMMQNMMSRSPREMNCRRGVYDQGINCQIR